MSQPPILEQNSLEQPHPEQLQSRTSDTPCAEPCQAAAPPKTFTQRLWQIFKLCTRIIVYVPLSLLVLMALLLGTEIGSRISVELADKFVPDLALTYTSGTLNKDLTLAHVSWSMAGIQVELEDLHLAWQPTCLLQKQLCVNALNASKVDVSIETDALSTDNNTNDTEVVSDDTDEPTELVLPFGITLDVADLNHINVRVDNMRFSANHITTSATWFAKGLTVEQLSSEGLAILIPTGDETTTAITGPTQVTQKTATTESETVKPATEAVKENTTNATDKPAEDKSLASAKPAPSTPSQSNTSAPTDKLADEWALAHLPQVFMPFPVNVKSLTLDNSNLQIGAREDVFSHIELDRKSVV